MMLTCIHSQIELGERERAAAARLVMTMENARDRSRQPDSVSDDEHPSDLVLDSDDDASDLLLAAAELGDADACRLLLRSGADIHVVDECERTALHLSVLHGQVDATRVL